MTLKGFNHFTFRFNGEERKFEAEYKVTKSLHDGIYSLLIYDPLATDTPSRISYQKFPNIEYSINKKDASSGDTPIIDFLLEETRYPFIDIHFQGEPGTYILRIKYLESVKKGAVAKISAVMHDFPVRGIPTLPNTKPAVIDAIDRADPTKLDHEVRNKAQVFLMLPSYRKGLLFHLHSCIGNTTLDFLTLPDINTFYRDPSETLQSKSLLHLPQGLTYDGVFSVESIE